VKIDAIAIQETWEIRYPELINIPGFQTFVFKNRANMRGGGVGFYIRNGLKYSVLEDLSPFEDKIFESLTIKLQYQNFNNVLLTCGYRSNGSIPNVTVTQQHNRFTAIFENLLHNLNRKKMESYIMMDSNIDLLRLDSVVPANFFNSCLAAGYLQCINKATRFQNESKTLIDHILISSKHNTIQTGTIISDVSDHFFTFVRLPLKVSKLAEKTKMVRMSNAENINRFKMLLAASDWADVTNSQCVDGSYDAFWSIYSNLYEICFPLKKIRFNRNIHKKPVYDRRPINI
jgi:exonuclease III